MNTILFIDDNERILLMLKRRFEKLGYKVFIAGDTKIGEQIFDENDIDLVCLDYMMPDISGYDFFQEFSSIHSIPVIMITAHPTLNLVIEFMKEGGVDFIEKPINIDVLDIKIKRAIENSKKLQEEIEARKAAERRLRHSNDELRQKSVNLEILYDELDQFTSLVSHELRSPIRNIGLLSQLLEKNASPSLGAEEQELVKIISDSSKKVNTLITELLNLAKMTKSEIKLQLVNTFEMVREIVNEILQTEDESQTQFDLTELPEIHADPILLRQVFMNLINNAVKYSSKEEHPCIQIGIETKAEDYIFYVKDNGIGFDQDQKDLLFQPFSRLHTQEDYEGTGIGLSNVKRIIQRHHGKVWAESKDKGAAFFFSIPQ